MKSFVRLLAIALVLTAAAFCATPPAASSPDASKVECSTFESHTLARRVPYCVVLPPAYLQQKQRRFPVSYYLHGLGDNEQSLINLGGWAEYDRLRHEKKIGDLVLIAPAGFTSFYVNSRDGRRRYEDFFLHEFMPAMEKKYRIATTRSGRGIMGVSMGGFGALHYAFKYPTMFSAVSANMPALIEHLPERLAVDWQQRLLGAIIGDPPDAHFFESISVFRLARIAPKSELNRMSIYFDCGTFDHYRFNLGTEALDKQLTAEGIAHEAHVYPGGHDWQFVLAHLGASLQAQWRALAKYDARGGH
ncbi:MAG: alpha/beta hydrolase-fold protein [Acidobacteriota bacterium]|nr:alpha/beta hydrolase-fold protein [Acidobacteriota bacterium]